MAGLLEKDIRLLLRRRQTLVLFFIIAIVMGFSMDGSFIIGYLTILCVIYSLRTLSFDEADNGLTFLMTLPVSEKKYAESKYVLCLTTGMLAWTLAVILMFLNYLVKGMSFVLTEELFGAVVMIPFFVIIVDLMLPFQLKYGMEKSRIVLMIVAGIVAAVSALPVTMGRQLSRPLLDLESLAVRLEQVPPMIWLLVLLTAAVLVTLLSITCSIRIMKKKQL